GEPQVLVELVQVGISGFTHRFPASAKVQHTGRRNSHLGYRLRVLLDEREMAQKRMIREADLSNHPQAPRLCRTALELQAGVGFVDYEAVKMVVKFEMPERAAILAL